jgi:beta-N-acetylhexosaminidase
MDLRDKVGQRLVLSFDGPELTPEVARLIVDCRAGGVILFAKNIESLEQVRRLNQNLQQLAADNGLPPLIISIDEEGGRVSRMPPDGVELTAPSQMAQAAAGLDAARICAASTARRLRRLGFNLNFAPVLDVNNNPANPVIGSRSFGSDPAAVAELGAEAVAGYLSEGFAPCAKHFPGHGDTAIDSHLGLPVVSKTLEQLRAVELLPFKRVLAAEVPAIMTAHITYPDIEPQSLPATLSPFFLGETGLLRRKFGFTGLIFTDALRMQAIYDHYGLVEASLLALKAGADIVMPLQEQEACFEAMVKAGERGEFEVEQSVARILAFKERFCLPALPLQDLEAEREVTATIARRSITLLRNRDGVLPLLPGKFRRPLLVHFEPVRLSYVENRNLPPMPALFDMLSAKLPELVHTSLPANFGEAEATQVLQTAADCDAIVIVERNAARLEHQANLINRLLGLNKPDIVVAALDPYDLAVFDADALVATYAAPPASLRALAEVLLGEMMPQGRLPVEIPTLAVRGDGLSEF